jgi:hypothetical protein
MPLRYVPLAELERIRAADADPAERAAAFADACRINARPAGDDRAPAAGGGRPHIAAQHPGGHRSLEGVPGGAVRERGGAEGAGGDPGDGARVRAPGRRAGLPAGIFNVVQGDGEEAEQPLVEHEDVAVVSFTGSTAVGRMIARVTGERLAKVCLELGGKNPLRGAAQASGGA